MKSASVGMAVMGPTAEMAAMDAMDRLDLRGHRGQRDLWVHRAHRDRLARRSLQLPAKRFPSSTPSHTRSRR
jgi:hypothetical protein